MLNLNDKDCFRYLGYNKYYKLVVKNEFKYNEIFKILNVQKCHDRHCIKSVERRCDLDIFDIIKLNPNVFEPKYYETTVKIYEGIISGKSYTSTNVKEIVFRKINSKYKTIYESLNKEYNHLERHRRTNLNIYHKLDFNLDESLTQLKQSINSLEKQVDFYEYI